MTQNTKLSTILAALAALAVAAAPAAAKPGHEKPAKPDKPKKGVSYVFKGTYAGDSSVAVTKGNKHAKEFAGETVAFDFSTSKLSVADTNGDTVVDLNDVVVGDSVVVKAKLPKGSEPTQPIAAKQLVDQTHPAAD